MLISTSIAPHGIENQRIAIASWRKLGFQVVSLNAADEIERLRPAFPDVEFISVERDARQKYGKPFVYFDDFLAFFRRRDELICGIINSDVLLISENTFSAFINKEAEGGLIFGSRIDVDSLASLQGEMYHMGFDYFFFDRKLLDVFPQEEFCIGQPWWDYWLPIVPLGEGLSAKRLMTPVAYHVKHPVNWNPRVRTYLGLVMSKYFRTPEAVTEKNMLHFLQFVCQLIREKAQEVHLK